MAINNNEHVVCISAPYQFYTPNITNLKLTILTTDLLRLAEAIFRNHVIAT